MYNVCEIAAQALSSKGYATSIDSYTRTVEEKALLHSTAP
jgi:hypothetical protein